jgi:hypothetical protein
MILLDHPARRRELEREAYPQHEPRWRVIKRELDEEGARGYVEPRTVAQEPDERSSHRVTVTASALPRPCARAASWCGARVAAAVRSDSWTAGGHHDRPVSTNEGPRAACALLTYLVAVPQRLARFREVRAEVVDEAAQNEPAEWSGQGRRKRPLTPQRSVPRSLLCDRPRSRSRNGCSSASASDRTPRYSAACNATLYACRLRMYHAAPRGPCAARRGTAPVALRGDRWRRCASHANGQSGLAARQAEPGG